VNVKWNRNFIMLPDYDAAIAYALRHLEQDLSPQLFYHSLDHTRREVVPAADRFASKEGLVGEEFQLLRIAAFFHDLGFTEQYDGHESVSARIAAEVLPIYHFMPAQVDVVCRAIMATRLPQSPTSLLEEVLVDADLDVLGKEDFFRRSKDLQRELATQGRGMDDPQWYATQVKFLKGHTYWTAAAKELRNTQKQRNIEHLERLLNQGNRPEM
jgi:uncharacterized protein